MELLCQASGVPTPTITWRRSGKEFPNDQTVCYEILPFCQFSRDFNLSAIALSIHGRTVYC